MQYASDEATDSGPPICTELCTKVAYSVVIHAIIYIEEHGALLIWMYFNCSVGCLEVQCNALPRAEWVSFLKRPPDFHG